MALDSRFRGNERTGKSSLMDLLTTAFLAGTGVVAGIIAAMVGGAAVVIYPALIATGVSPQLAAVCNLASVMPATMLAALADRSQLPPFDRAFISLIVASIVGAGLGAALLVLTPERLFAQIVPLLLAFATLLFAYSERISALAAGACRRPRPCHRVRFCQPEGCAAGLVLRRIFRRRRRHPDARRVFACNRGRLSRRQCHEEFCLQPERACGDVGVRDARRRVVAANLGARRWNNRRRD